MKRIVLYFIILVIGIGSLTGCMKEVELEEAVTLSTSQVDPKTYYALEVYETKEHPK